MEMRCPSCGAKLVADAGWMRCPTEKCKVLVK